MLHKSASYIDKVIAAIVAYQNEHLLSDRELSIQANMSPTMVSKIKKKTTIPKLMTLRKLRATGVTIPNPGGEVEIAKH
jgi:transcriptional regulator with XRE-family HTH domain